MRTRARRRRNEARPYMALLIVFTRLTWPSPTPTASPPPAPEPNSKQPVDRLISGLTPPTVRRSLVFPSGSVMPRRPPGEIRTEQLRRRSARSRQDIPGLSAATNRQIAQFELQCRLPSGHVAHAFRAWALALHSWPNHGPNHGCGTTVWRDGHARTLLQGAASAMNRKARRELLGAVAPLDERFMARTLPDPFSPSTDLWWKRRLAE